MNTGYDSSMARKPRRTKPRKATLSTSLARAAAPARARSTRSGAELASRSKDLALRAGHGTIDAIEGFIDLVKGYFTPERRESIRAGASSAAGYAAGAVAAAGRGAYRAGGYAYSAGSAGVSKAHAFIRSKLASQSPAQAPMTEIVQIAAPASAEAPAAAPRFKGIMRGSQGIRLSVS